MAVFLRDDARGKHRRGGSKQDKAAAEGGRGKKKGAAGGAAGDDGGPVGGFPRYLAAWELVESSLLHDALGGRNLGQNARAPAAGGGGGGGYDAEKAARHLEKHRGRGAQKRSYRKGAAGMAEGLGGGGGGV